MLDAFRDHEQVAGSKRYVPVAHSYGEATLQYKKEIIGVVVLVPIELTFHFHHHHVMAVEMGDGSRLPVLRKRCELFPEPDCMHDLPLPYNRIKKDAGGN
jgi:hypothetical protein